MTEKQPSTRRTITRWILSFAGYPLGGYAALLIVGRVDNWMAAAAGGLITGAILGSVQAWAMGRACLRPTVWVAATAGGFMVGLTAGAQLVDYQTDMLSLALQGAVTGATLGLFQTPLLLRRVGGIAFVWPIYLAGVFAVAWAITMSAGIDVDEQFTVFGSSGALVAALFTLVLPLALRRGHGGIARGIR